MVNGYDLAYAAGLAVAAPVWAARRRTREKVLSALGQRMGHVRPRDGSGPAVLIHAVSLGEMNATAELVRQLRAARPDVAVVVSVTTDTGYARGRQLYPVQSGVQLVRFPLDFSVAIHHLLDAVRPSLVVLMEGELWPNFLLQCERRGTPVILVNGRVTPGSFRNYRRARPVTEPMLRRLSAVCVQDEAYAEQFRQLGAPADRVAVTGTMKFDTALVADRAPGDEALAAGVGLPGHGRPARASGEAHGRDARATDPVWVCGSTGPGEEEMILDAYAQLTEPGRVGPGRAHPASNAALAEHASDADHARRELRSPRADTARLCFPNLRLVIVPRHPQRFDEVARLIERRGLPLFRRSTNSGAGIILGDTMGELRTFYSLATVVFVGRSLVDLGHRQHGSDMIEPAALAKPVAVGPWTQNFADAVRAFRADDALAEVTDVSTLAATIAGWLADPAAATAMGRRAQDVVRRCQGATARHVAEILRWLPAQSDDSDPPRR
jgi:3-deoxy-D-manno-octulosonic-acid transferase